MPRVSIDLQIPLMTVVLDAVDTTTPSCIDEVTRRSVRDAPRVPQPEALDQRLVS
jgi:hypothetical protein